jgi:hypothetical protein
VDIRAGEMSVFGPEGCPWAYLRRDENGRISISRLNLQHGRNGSGSLHPFCWAAPASPTSPRRECEDIELR